ncbi:PREDICTED: kelch-like protein 29 isoform X1 [Branchiostoma belcheri]|uniref:Kelch-like protein 29 isoform X1 n=2 Tax=Branchiostoma belcheri TaxID=7741 RepID=A0A6P4Y4Z0_BRABE|nr:PREDICTED: kelch-like protein 29 isoform X1 [Branchiostoma belcheri]KAI8482251.1 Kelch-like protein 29 [Branchiostoma belcheri]
MAAARQGFLNTKPRRRMFSRGSSRSGSPASSGGSQVPSPSPHHKIPPLPDNNSEFDYFDDTHSSEILSLLNEQRLQNEFTDVVVCVDKHEFPCHRAVLAASSPYFNAMFSIEMRESKQEKIMLEEVQPEGIKLLVDFAYTGRAKITKANAQALLEAACMFQYTKMRDACGTFLEKNLDPSNVLAIVNLADALCCRDLHRKSMRYALQKFAAVARQEEMLSLSKEEIVNYLSHDNLEAQHEEAVFEAATRWLRHDFKSRKAFSAEVLSAVRFPFLRPTYLLSAVEGDSIIQNDKNCRALVEEAKRFHLLQMEGRGLESPRTKPRSCVGSEVIFIVGSSDKVVSNLDDVRCYHPESKEWYILPNLPSKYVMRSVVALNDDVYVSGGMLNGLSTDEVWKYSSRTGIWNKDSPMRQARDAHGSAVVEGSIYVVGGEASGAILNSVERFDPLTNRWEDVPPLVKAVFGCSVAAHRGKLYVIGGVANNGSNMQSHLIQCYSPETRIWTSIESPLVDNKAAPTAVLNDSIYIIGGFSSSCTVYEPGTNNIQRVADMHVPRALHGSAVEGNKVYAIGGLPDVGKAPHDTMECYDPATDTWEIQAALPKAIIVHGCCTIRMNIATLEDRKLPLKDGQANSQQNT